MRTPLFWGEPELTFLRRFFDGVDKAVTEEMQAGRVLLEESLTFVLARLLDGESTFQKILDYPLGNLNVDLERCGSGSQVKIELETNEHKKSFESAVSHADLGIILRREHSVFGPSLTKAVIVQSKKLYPAKDKYRLVSAYEGFDVPQFKALREIASTHDWDGVCYFLYNPKLDAFEEANAKVIKAMESRIAPQFAWPGATIPFWHPEMEYFLHKYLRRFPVFGGAPVSEIGSPERALEERQKLVALKPGLRVMGISSIAQLVESKSTVKRSFRLAECYRYATSDHWWGNSGTVPFLPLSSFLVDLFIGCSRGSENEKVIRIAEGKPQEPEPSPEGPTPGLAVRHTLRITVRSTLPQTDVSFHQ